MKRFSRLLRSNSLLEERLLFPTNFPIPFSPNYYLWKIRYVVLLVLSFFLSWKKWKGKWKFSKRAQFFLRESLPRIGISSIMRGIRLRMALVVGEAWDGVESRAIIGSNFCLLVMREIASSLHREKFYQFFTRLVRFDSIGRLDG